MRNQSNTAQEMPTAIQGISTNKSPEIEFCSLQFQMKAHYSYSSADKFPTPLLTIFPDKILDII